MKLWNWPVEIEWSKVVTQAVTTVVVATFMGACFIVWRGATSVDAKVKTTEARIEFVIKELSDKLATYEVQLSNITNQLGRLVIQTNVAVVSIPPLLGIGNQWINQTNVLESKGQEALAPKLSQRQQAVEQKARSKDIYDSFNKSVQQAPQQAPQVPLN
jgi:hypothetical protein